jgi:hypothetical protein
MSTWRMLRNVAKNKTEPIYKMFGGKVENEPENKLPLGIHIGGKIQLEQTSFLLGRKGEIPLQLESPGKELIVIAYGQIKYDNANVYRIYLESVDSSKEAMLQIVEEDGNIAEIRLFRTIDEIYPTDEDEWDFWLAEADGYIGLNEFSLKEEDFPDSIPPSYLRVWGEDSQFRVKPLEWKEFLRSAQDESRIIQITHQLMLYGRWVNEDNDIAEYVLLDMEESSDEACVNVFLGIEIEPAGIKMIY